MIPNCVHFGKKWKKDSKNGNNSFDYLGKIDIYGEDLPLFNKPSNNMLRKLNEGAIGIKIIFNISRPSVVTMTNGEVSKER